MQHAHLALSICKNKKASSSVTLIVCVCAAEFMGMTGVWGGGSAAAG